MKLEIVQHVKALFINTASGGTFHLYEGDIISIVYREKSDYNDHSVTGRVVLLDHPYVIIDESERYRAKDLVKVYLSDIKELQFIHSLNDSL